MVLFQVALITSPSLTSVGLSSIINIYHMTCEGLLGDIEASKLLAVDTLHFGIKSSMDSHWKELTTGFDQQRTEQESL